jgi:hypothetical protein
MKSLFNVFVFLLIFLSSISCNNFDQNEVLRGTIFDSLQDSFWQPILPPCNGCLIKNNIGFDFTAGNNELEKFIFNYKVPVNNMTDEEPELNDEKEEYGCHVREFIIIERPISLKNNEIVFTLKETILEQNRPVNIEWLTSIKLIDISTLEIIYTRSQEDISTGTLLTFTRSNQFRRVSIPEENKLACE